MFEPLSYKLAYEKARPVLASMTLEEKLAYVGGDRMFFIRPIERLGLDEVLMADATQGVRLINELLGVDLSMYGPEKSTAFPCAILLAATWSPDLAYRYAEAVGEECRAGGIGILLGPGMNIYRHAQCGRNFEYFGEDPFLAGRMVSGYVEGIQSTGVAATLKHFAANNTDYYRRKSNSIVDERALHEIYMPAFKAGIDAGAKAVMTSYNQLNGEWCGQSEYVISYLLRERLGFKWLVMTDWWSVSDGEKLAASGQDIEMPYAIALENAHRLIEAGKVKIGDIDRMVMSILCTCFAMKLHGRKKEPVYYEKYPEHETVALQTAREGIVLLKNEDNILPLKKEAGSILLTGEYVEKMAVGGGAAEVKGYNNVTMLDAFIKEFGDRVTYVADPTTEQIRAADVVLCNVGTFDSEGWDRPFALPDDREQRVLSCVGNNPNTIVIVTSGSGIRMTGWNDKAKAVIYAWYGGQNGNTALAEIIAGKTNPSGKLPITIEKEFSDSPGFGYIPEGESLYDNWNDEEEKKRDVYDIHYKEGIFVGYRWYESKNIEPLYPFGHGLSYTSFEYTDLAVSVHDDSDKEFVSVRCTVTNTGARAGSEIVQVYVQDVECSVPRPVKELKGFRKVYLEPGESKQVVIPLDRRAFSFWDPVRKEWLLEEGMFRLYIGSSSMDIRLHGEVRLG